MSDLVDYPPPAKLRRDSTPARFQARVWNSAGGPGTLEAGGVDTGAAAGSDLRVATVMSSHAGALWHPTNELSGLSGDRADPQPSRSRPAADPWPSEERSLRKLLTVGATVQAEGGSSGNQRKTAGLFEVPVV